MRSRPSADLESSADRVRQLRCRPEVGGAVEAAPDTPEMFDADGSRRKLIVFTEHRDTLNYLVGKLRDAARPAGGRRRHPRRDAPRGAAEDPGGLHPGQGRA